MDREDLSYFIFCFVPPLVLIGVLSVALFSPPFQVVLPLGVAMPTRLVISAENVELGLIAGLVVGFMWLYIGLLNWMTYYWTSGDEDWGNGGGGHDDDGHDLPPDPSGGIDWERFTEEFWEHVEREKVMA